MYPITAPPQGASAAARPALGEPSFNIAGTLYTAAQFQALTQHGGYEDGYYQLVPKRRMLEWLAVQEATEADGTMNGPAWLVAFLMYHDGSLWTAYDEGVQPRLPGGPDIGPCIPYTPFERFLVSLPECTPGQAMAAIRGFLAAQRIAA